MSTRRGCGDYTHRPGCGMEIKMNAEGSSEATNLRGSLTADKGCTSRAPVHTPDTWLQSKGLWS